MLSVKDILLMDQKQFNSIRVIEHDTFTNLVINAIKRLDINSLKELMHLEDSVRVKAVEAKAEPVKKKTTKKKTKKLSEA